VLYLLTPGFGAADWIYLSQHLVVLGIALTRRAPAVQDRSVASGAAVLVAYTYPYAQMVYLARVPGRAGWPAPGLVLIVLAACLSLASLFFLGRRFGNRPALRGLATMGPYRLVRHPMYLSYVLADIGYNLNEWNVGTVVLVLIGWAALVYRIGAEERVLSRDAGWLNFRDQVRFRLIPGLW
jgi:protein-S-isoprenylcysteine O-methyltransferase Ste14